MKEAKKRGEHRSYDEIVNSLNSQLKEEIPRKKRRKKSDELSSADLDKTTLVDYPDSKESPAF